MLADCTDVALSPVTTDQRFFPRPEPAGTMCNVGAFEAQPTGKLTIMKETDPPGGMDFEFLGTGFPDGCDLMDTFFLGDMEMEMCILPLGVFTVEEIMPPQGILLDIMCDDGTLPDTFTSVTVDIGDMDDVTCMFTNLQAAEVKITKLTIPPGGTGFEFASTGFENFPPCDITPAFTLDNQQMATCLVLTDSFTITEAIPAGQILNIFCEELPAIFNINIDTGTSMGTLGFTIADLSESVDCLFINSPANTVVRIMDEPPGANCEFGGTKIESGLDTNQNGVLDDGEVNPALTAFACNGEPGTIVRVTPEPAGPNCEFGGQKIESGLDTNQNGILDPNEVTDTFFVCDGDPGAQGPEGPDGPEGPPGEDGDTPLLDIVPIPQGSEECPEGGIRINTGNDTNGNGLLDEGEIEISQVVCNGEDGSNKGCAVAGAGSPKGLNNLAELFALLIVPFIVVLGRRFTKRRIQDAG